MNLVTQRISDYAAGGAVGGATLSILNAGNMTSIFLSLAIGFVAGAAAGAAASVPLPKIRQGLFVGAAAGLCVGLLRYYLLGTEDSLAKSIFVHVPSLGLTGLTIRCFTRESEMTRWFAVPAPGKAAS